MNCSVERTVDGVYGMTDMESMCETSLYMAHLSLSLQNITAFKKEILKELTEDQLSAHLSLCVVASTM